MDEWDKQIYMLLGDIPDDEREAIKEVCLNEYRIGCSTDPLTFITLMKPIYSRVILETRIERSKWQILTELRVVALWDWLEEKLHRWKHG